MKSKFIYIGSFILASILSNIMCVHVAWKWFQSSYVIISSAPSWVNIVYAIPYSAVILILVLVGFHYKARIDK